MYFILYMLFLVYERYSHYGIMSTQKGESFFILVSVCPFLQITLSARPLCTAHTLFYVQTNIYLFFYVYCTVNHLHSWIKRDQLDVTCFFISLFNAQHVSDVNTSILRSLRLICWVISWDVLLWCDACWCYVLVWLWWCGNRMQVEAMLQPASTNKSQAPEDGCIKHSKHVEH